MVKLRHITLLAGRLHGLLPRRLRRGLAEKRAAVALIVAICAPVLIGFTAMGTDAGYWYGSHEALQAGLDAAAFSAAHFATANTPQSVLETVAINAANQATHNQFGFNSQNLTATLVPDGNSVAVVGQPNCYRAHPGPAGPGPAGPGPAPVTCPPTPPGPHAPPPPPGGGPAQTSISASSTMNNVSVAASVSQPVFFAAAFLTPSLQTNAGSVLQSNLTPPPNDTCVTSVGNTGVSPLGSFHVGGPSFGSCGDTSLQLTQIPMGNAYEGYLNQTAYHLNSNGGALPASNPQGIPGSAPNCDGLYDPTNPTVNAGNPTSTSDNGTLVYFGPATATASGYSFSPILVEPGSEFCDSNNVCTVPAGAYCGGLQIDPGVTLNFVDHDGSDNFMILDGNLVVPNIGMTYGPSNDPNANFLFGGSTVGWLMQNTQTAVYPGEIQNGTLVYTTTTTSVVANTGGGTSEDQICPGGVIPTGLTSSGAPLCPVVTQSTNSQGQTNTNVSPSQTVAGQTTQGYNYNYGSTPLEQVDTYITKITFKNGIPVYSQASEATTTSSYDSTTGQYEQVSSGGSINLSVSGAIGGNSAATPDAASNDCQATDKNNLFSSQTPTGQGYSFSGSAGQGTTQQVDTIEVCGTGPQLIADPTGAEIVASGTMTNHFYLTE